ncbi:hypothetical protein AtubIFM54640_006574 [Aspergillus tubingensis]|nr:hypothetical protein AtubIFM54640_006574 [Aspergillus tubingensis]
MPQYCELKKPLSELDGITLDLSNVVTKRFRFIVIDSLLNDQVLEITSFSALPTDGNRFATISYPWQGLDPLESPSLGQFLVKGAEGGGSISVNVLRTCCRAARQPRHRISPCDLLWIDRLCIKQQDEEDKHWQIRQMFDIYKSCAMCLVLPGGLRRLIKLTERSTWAQRAWTLQEAVAPPVVFVVFEWKFPKSVFAAMCEPVEVLEPFHSGTLSLKGLIMAARTNLKMVFVLPHPEDPVYNAIQEERERIYELESKLEAERGRSKSDLGDQGCSPEIDAVSQRSLTDEAELDSELSLSEIDNESQEWSTADSEVESRGASSDASSDEPDEYEGYMHDQSDNCSDVSTRHESAPPSLKKDILESRVSLFGINLKAQTITQKQAYLLWLTEDASREVREEDFGQLQLQVALWKGAWIRSSSRPVDMVFSIMGMFGVSLDPSKFHKNDRAGATLALASAALKRGKSAAWMGAYLELDPCPIMSSFPLMPSTSEIGGCTIQTASGLMNVEDLVDVENVVFTGASGTLDSQGYLHFKNKACPLDWSGESSGWSDKDHIPVPSGAWVLRQSKKFETRYHAIRIGGQTSLVPGPETKLGFIDPVVLYIVERHSRNPDRWHRISHARVTEKFIADWEEYELAIGGPNEFGPLSIVQ